MQRSEVHIGQWVRFQDKTAKHSKSVIGFVIHRDSRVATVTSIIEMMKYEVPYHMLHDCEEVTYRLEDIDAMIDVALDTRDFEWVENLAEMKRILQGGAIIGD